MNWPKYLQIPFGHSATYSPIWSPDPLSRISASVKGGSSLDVRRSGHKHCGPWNLCRARYSSHISGGTRLLPSTGLHSLVISLRDSQTTNHTRRTASAQSLKDRMSKYPENSRSHQAVFFDRKGWLWVGCLASWTKISVECCTLHFL